MNTFAVTNIVALISNLAIAILFFIKVKDKSISKNFCWTPLIASVWAFAAYFLSVSKTYEEALFWAKIAHISVILTPIVFAHFVISYTNSQEKLLKKFIYSLAILFLSLNFFYPKFYKIDFVFNEFFFFKATLWENPFHIFFYVSIYWFVLLYAFFLLTRFFIKTTGGQRNQVKYFLIGMAVAWLGPEGMFLLVLGFPLYPYTNLLVAIYPLILAYAILKHRLMDINLVIRKAAIYSIIYGLIISLFIFIVNLFGQFMVYGHIEKNFYLVSIFALALITPLVRPLDSLLTSLTDKIFFQKKYAYQKALKDASIGMTRIKSLPTLLELIVETIVNSIRVSQATIFLLDKDRDIYIAAASEGKNKVTQGLVKANPSSSLVSWLLKHKEILVRDEVVSKLKRETDLDEELRLALESLGKEMSELEASVCVPSFMEDKMIDFLVLGEKLSGDMYTQEDLDLFSTLANNAALAIENAQSYEELKDSREQLVQSERLATIGKFANEVAHEIKNPLQAIRTFVEYLPKKLNDQEFMDKFTKIAGGEIERIDSFVQELAHFSNAKPLKLVNLDIQEILDNTLLLLDNDFKKKNAELIRRYSKKEAPILADKDQIKQVFLNLFLNSLEAMDMEKRNQLIVETSLENNALVVVEITDTGSGISDKNLARLFNPFFTTKQNGSGLGLNIVKSIVENHKGKISVESKLGEGTSFSITLPCKQ